MLSAQKPPVPTRGPVPNADSAGKGASQAPLVRGACDLDHVRAGLRPVGGSSFIPTTWQPEPLRPSPGAALTHGMAVPPQGLGPPRSCVPRRWREFWEVAAWWLGWPLPSQQMCQGALLGCF